MGKFKDIVEVKLSIFVLKLGIIYVFIYKVI